MRPEWLFTEDGSLIEGWDWIFVISTTTIAVQAFATRLADPELDPAGLAYKPNLNLRGPASLTVGFASIKPSGR